jgi:DNA repair protein RecO (recombination protein O)
LPGIVKTTGIVVLRHDWGNSSRIYTFLTPKHGRISALLKGARRPKGRPGLGGGLDLLSENEILYYQRRSGLSVLAEWYEIASAAELGGDPVRFAAAEACAELVRECSVEGAADPGLYELLLSGIRLAKGADRLAPLTLSVALSALSLAGFRPGTEKCAACEGELAAGGQRPGLVLSGGEGGLVCEGCARQLRNEAGAPRLSPEAVALFRALLRLEVEAAARLRPSRNAERELLRATEHYASWKLERRIRGLSGLMSIISSLEAVGCN